MSTSMRNPHEGLRRVAEGDLSMVQALAHIIEGSFEASGLDPKTFMLVRIAALTTLDASPASWLLNLEAGGDAGLTSETILGTLIAIAPVIGTPRIVSAADNIMKALALAEQM